MAEDVCATIASQVARMLDKEMGNGLENQQTQRPQPVRLAGTKVSVAEGGAWRTSSGYQMYDHGPAIVPRTNAEKLSLIGNTSHLREGGNELATRIERWQNISEVDHGQEMLGVKLEHRRQGTNLEKFTPEENANLIQVVEQRNHKLNKFGAYENEPGSMKIAPINDRVAKAAEIEGRYYKDSDRQMQTDVQFYKSEGPNYAPIAHETDLLRTQAFRAKSLDGLADKIAKSNGRSYVTPDDISAAQLVFSKYVNRQYAKVGANIQRERLWDIGEGRILDPIRLREMHSLQKWRAIHEKRIFGERSSLDAFPDAVKRLEGSIVGAYPGDNKVATQVHALVQDSFGIIPADPVFNSALVSSLNDVQALKLSMSVLKNSLQSGNTAMATSARDLLKAIHTYAANSEVSHGIKARDFVGQLASVGDEAAYNATLYQGGHSFLGRAGEWVLKYSGFSTVERWNRSFAGLAAVFYAERQAAMLAERGGQRYARQLVELGINPEKALASLKATGSLALEDKLIAGQKIINATQFRARGSDLPYFTTNNPAMWRALLTFRTFSLNQVRFMWDMAAKKPARAALFGLAVMPMVGSGATFMHDVITRDIIGAKLSPSQDNQDGMAKYLEAAGAAGSYGFISDALYASYMSGENQSYKNFLVPTLLSSADDYLLAAGQLARGKFPQLARTVGRQFGGLGAAFSNRIFPPNYEGGESQ